MARHFFGSSIFLTLFQLVFATFLQTIFFCKVIFFSSTIAYIQANNTSMYNVVLFLIEKFARHGSYTILSLLFKYTRKITELAMNLDTHSIEMKVSFFRKITNSSKIIETISTFQKNNKTICFVVWSNYVIRSEDLVSFHYWYLAAAKHVNSGVRNSLEFLKFHSLMTYTRISLPLSIIHLWCDGYTRTCGTIPHNCGTIPNSCFSILSVTESFGWV